MVTESVKKTLEMRFVGTNNRTYTVTITNPKEGLTRSTVESVMYDILTYGVFGTLGGGLTDIKDYYYRQVDIQGIF